MDKMKCLLNKGADSKNISSGEVMKKFESSSSIKPHSSRKRKKKASREGQEESKEDFRRKQVKVWEMKPR